VLEKEVSHSSFFTDMASCCTNHYHHYSENKN